MLKLIVLALVFAIKSFALVCGQFGTFVEYNGHYYTATKDRLTFTYAKTFAEAADGYLAVPSSQDENEFLASLVLGNQFAWIGVHDPLLSNNYCYESGSCSYDSSRFKTINNNALNYSNWEVNQPDNLLKISDINQLIEISPLGEHWVALSSVNYKWYDFGNHNDEYNNPAKFLAIYEFDTVPECFNSDDSSELVDLHCNTAVSSTDGLIAESGQLMQCETDENGVSYCPANLAPCNNTQNTNDGYSQEHSGTTLGCPDGTATAVNNNVVTDCYDVDIRDTSMGTNYNCPTGVLDGAECCDTETYTASSSTSYSCPNGGTRSGTTCNKICSTTSYSCPNGGTRSDTTCTISPVCSCPSGYWKFNGGCKKPTAAASICPNSCPSGASPGGFSGTCADGSPRMTNCNYFAPLTCTGGGSYSASSSTSTYDCSYSASSSTTYSCNSGDTRSGTTCTHITDTCMPATQDHYCTGSGTQNSITCSGSFTNEWLKSLYTDHLCRCPDQAGYNYWLAELNDIGDYYLTYEAFHIAATLNGETFSTNGCPSINNSSAYNTAPTCSGNFQDNFIYSAYVDHLCRCPDQAGYDWWVDMYNNRGDFTEEDILLSIKQAATANGEEWKSYCGSLGQNACYDTDVTRSNPISTSYLYYTYHCNADTNVYNESYVPTNEGGEDYTDVNPPSNNCVQQNYVCPYDAEQICTDGEHAWQCSPHPCVDANDMEHTDTEVGSQDGDDDGWNQQTGACDGQLYLFGGTSAACRSWDLYGVLDGSECCSDNALLFGLIRCSSEEKILAQKRKAGNCHYVGEFCSRKLRLGFARICVQKKKSSCCFNSELARIINEQGRPQLNKGWGTASNPECKGFTPEEFQKLDLSKIDFTEFTENIQLPNMQDLGESIKNRVENNLNVSFPQQ
ncbi:conjugal transfer protein TraN [Sulfurimonas sp.]|jgi:conjugal transfer mating pair stabilization protein TraN|uniref:conjugal transfer protein TraN n=1 Tax=Sulfurimonas sp. TaxID=2022749 RepID=UPI0025CE654C|nr:conjugal transfer protein TraN [Sulfurimonas sp.]MCK9473985.1 conjugal transfer protein TraN [Sulfurimonas sp.]